MLECDIELYKINVTGYEDVGSMTREQFQNKKLTASFVDADTSFSCFLCPKICF